MLSPWGKGKEGEKAELMLGWGVERREEKRFNSRVVLNVGYASEELLIQHCPSQKLTARRSGVGSRKSSHHQTLWFISRDKNHCTRLRFRKEEQCPAHIVSPVASLVPGS